MRLNKLSINFSKTEFMVVTKKKKYSLSKIENEMKQQSVIKYLGVLIDDKVSWKPQIKEQHSKVCRDSWAMHRLKNYVYLPTLRATYFALIYPHLQY